MIRQPPRATRLPYTTRFRSLGPEDLHEVVEVRARRGQVALEDRLWRTGREAARERDHALRVLGEDLHVDARLAAVRSEEHMSELQSRHYLLCRLLLDNKLDA